MQLHSKTAPFLQNRKAAPLPLTTRPASHRLVCAAQKKLQTQQAVRERVQEAARRVQERWESIPNKRGVVSTVLVGVVGLSFSSALLDTVDRLPVLPQLLTLVGLWSTTTFFWRYVLFADGRKELELQISELYLKAIERAYSVPQSSKPGEISSRDGSNKTVGYTTEEPAPSDPMGIVDKMIEESGLEGNGVGRGHAEGENGAGDGQIEQERESEAKQGGAEAAREADGSSVVD